MIKRYWCGEPPKTCDVTGEPIKSVFVDGRTKTRLWAFMSPEGHRLAGCGLGEGRGQMYQRQADGRWLKVAG